LLTQIKNLGSGFCTGNVRQKTGVGQVIEWIDALTYAQIATAGGDDNWHLPNIKELQSIVYYNRFPSVMEDSK